VGRRDHGPHGTQPSGLEGDCRGWRDAQASDLDPLGSEAGHECGLEHRCRDATVTADNGESNIEYPSGSATEVERERCGEFGVGSATDTVGAEAHERNLWPSADQRLVN
jgi:hypothetical protein